MKRFLLMLWLAGCSSAKNSDEASDSGSSVPGGGGDDTGSDGGGSSDLPSLWTLDADLVLTDGVLGTLGSAVSLGHFQDGVVGCTDTLSIDQATAEEELPHDTVYTWWTVTWEADALACFDAELTPASGEVLIGIGEMHPEIRALLDRLDEVEAPEAGTTLNAAYASLDGGETLLVYGVAGLQDAYAGLVGPAEQAPLADGTWLVRALYSFGLEPG